MPPSPHQAGIVMEKASFFGNRIRENSIGMEFSLIPASFVMGSPDGPGDTDHPPTQPAEPGQMRGISFFVPCRLLRDRVQLFSQPLQMIAVAKRPGFIVQGRDKVIAVGGQSLPAGSFPLLSVRGSIRQRPVGLPFKLPGVNPADLGIDGQVGGSLQDHVFDF